MVAPTRLIALSFIELTTEYKHELSSPWLLTNLSSDSVIAVFMAAPVKAEVISSARKVYLVTNSLDSIAFSDITPFA